MNNDEVVASYYKATPVFDQDTLPEKLRKSHLTKAGTWGVIRVLEGSVRYIIEDPNETHILTADCPGIVLPEQRHHVEPIGAMRMCVEFYDHPPSLKAQKS